MHNPKTDWCFKTEPDDSINGRSINYPRGKTLGGSSSINGLLYIRGQSRDYDIWRQQGNTGWGWDDDMYETPTETTSLVKSVKLFNTHGSALDVDIKVYDASASTDYEWVKDGRY